MKPLVEPMFAVCRRGQCGGCTQALRSGSVLAAQRWLGRAQHDDARLAALRRVAQGLGGMGPVRELADAAVLEALAAELADGRLLACGAAVPRRLYALRGVPPAAPPPPAPRRRATAAPVLEPEAEAEIDVAAMVQALVDAARDGVPFCEECERERRAVQEHAP